MSVNEKRIFKRLKYQRKRQKQYICYWSPHDSKKQYDALNDPNTYNYFINPSIQRHLRKFSYNISFERNNIKRYKLQKSINDNIIKNCQLPMISTKSNLSNIKTNKQFNLLSKSDNQGFQSVQKKQVSHNQLVKLISQIKKKRTQSLKNQN